MNEKEARRVGSDATGETGETSADIVAESAQIVKGDLALIAKIKRSKNGAEFSALWDGDAGEKPHSEAVRELCSTLAWWTNRDKERIDRLFRAFGLMTAEWDDENPSGGGTFGQTVIQSACDSCQGGYDPAAHFKEQADKITVRTESGTRSLADFHPERNDRYKWSDIGNGRLFADWYKSRARYCPEKRTWYCYDGTRWVADVGGLAAMQLCKRLADELAIYALALPEGTERDGYRKHVENWQNRRYREVILKDAASVHPVAVSEFDRDPYLYNCLNCTLDLRTFSPRPHSPADMLSLISNVNYNPDAKSPLWAKTVSDAMQGDAGKIAFLQKLFGRGLTGVTFEERMYILFGRTSRNGKGTMVESYMTMNGGYGKAVSPESITQKQFANGSAPSEDIARLAGARVASVSEPDKNMVLSAGLVKSLTGNDTIRARFLRENTIEFKPQFKLIVNCNHLPKITDATVFTSDRIAVITFDRHFRPEERDTHLKEKLATPESLSGILNWCLDGLRLIGEVGFDPPESVIAATSAYWDECDKNKRFYDECLTKDASSELRSEEVYARYAAWCTNNGQHAESSEHFKANMAPFMEFRRKRPAGAGRTANPLAMFVGVRWKEGA